MNPRKRQPPRTVFSLAMTINGAAVSDFGSVRISYSCSGDGVSGVCMTCLTFMLPPGAAEYAGGSAVILSGAGTLPDFFISSHTESDGGFTYICYDSMMKLECDLIPDGSAVVWHEYPDKPGVRDLPISTVCGMIASQCGFAVNIGTVSTYIPYIGSENLIGRSCRDVLELIARSAVGYFGFYNGEAYFLPYGSAASIGVPYSIADHEELKNGGTHSYMRLKMSGGGNEYSYGSDSAGASTLTADTQLASADLCSAAGSRVVGYQYLGFSCPNAFGSEVVMFPALVSFSGADGAQLRINYCTADISAAGVFMQLGSNIVSDAYHYTGLIKRELVKRFGDGDIWGNFQISKSDGAAFYYKEDQNGQDQ